AAGVVAGVVVVVIAGTGNTRQAAVGLSTQQVIARTAAFVRGLGGGILHVDSTTTSTTKNGHQASFTIDRWSEEKAPYDFRVSSTTVQEIKVGNTLTAYRSDFNQISVGNLRTGPVPVQVQDPLATALARVDVV